MKTVLLVSNKVFHYRVSNYNYFARRLREDGWRLVVRANELQRNNPYAIEFDYATLPFRFAAYRREILRLRPQAVIVFLHLKNLILWPLLHWLKLKRIPVIYWNKGVNLELPNPGLRNWPFYYVHGLCDRILLYSNGEVTDIRPANRHKVFVANNTINFSAIPQIAESREAIKQSLGIPFRKLVLFVGRMRRVKKVEHLIEAFNGIDDPGVGCVIVGDAMDYNLTDSIRSANVRYLGEIFDPKNERISRLFKAADVFCIPGDVGLGLNEAFYWSLPVVTEAGLQPPEIHYLKDGRNGFLVPENDVVGLRHRLLQLLRDDELRMTFARNAREDILREGSIERMYGGFLQCLRSLAPSTQHLAP